MTGAERRVNSGGPEAAPDAGLPPGVVPQSAGDVPAPPYERVDMLIHRLFEVGLDLHAALGHFREHVEVEVGARKIYEAIVALDEAIKECRGVAVDLWPPDRCAPDAAYSVVAHAAERSREPGGPCPLIPLSAETGHSGPVPPSRRPEEGPAPR